MWLEAYCLWEPPRFSTLFSKRSFYSLRRSSLTAASFCYCCFPRVLFCTLFAPHSCAHSIMLLRHKDCYLDGQQNHNLSSYLLLLALGLLKNQCWNLCFFQLGAILTSRIGSLFASPLHFPFPICFPLPGPLRGYFSLPVKVGLKVFVAMTKIHTILYIQYHLLITILMQTSESFQLHLLSFSLSTNTSLPH